MKETDTFPQEEKLNSPSIGDDPEALRNLEAAIESGIDNLEFSKPVTVKYVETPLELKYDEPDSDEEEEQEEFSEFDEEEEDWKLFKRRSGKEGNSEKPPGNNSAANETPEPDPEEDSGDLDEDDFDDVAYIQSAAYKRRVGRTLTYEQREERRTKRIERFWDFVDRRRKQIRWGFVGLFVLIVAAVSGILARNWTYHSIKELVVSEKEDTLSVSYANINGKVLKYGVDSAMLVDHNNDMLWTISYEMNNPEVTLCGETFAIYDSKGTSIRVCDVSGQMGEVSTDMPIVKANVSKQGVVAAILEDGQNAWIKSYDKDGSEIATLKTTFSNPGYPMDLALSEDGILLAVDYLYMDNGTPVSRVSFYNFGTVGQNQKDNLVAETEYRDRISPEMDYLDSGTCVVFREDGFSVFTGSQIPSESVKVDVDQSIVSTFHDSEYIGLVLQNRNSENAYLICVYNKKGKEILRKETDFHYQAVELNGGQVVLSSKDDICVYNLQGVEKYRGSLEVPARVFIGFGRNKFIYVSEDLFRIVQIR